MLMVISPAKKLDMQAPCATTKITQADLLDQAQLLVKQLRQLAPQDISALMSISDPLGILNYERYQQWQLPFSQENAMPALFAFKGDVYVGLDAHSLNEDELDFAQQHLRILSGLYGVLRPLDLMQAYRLEMGTRLHNVRGNDLYQFWGNTITQALNAQLKKNRSHTLVNLASAEYFKSIQTHELEAEIITPVFKDKKNGQYKIVSFYAKKARGLMAAYVIKNHITDVAKLQQFAMNGYAYNDALSTANQWVFTRSQ